MLHVFNFCNEIHTEQFLDKHVTGVIYIRYSKIQIKEFSKIQDFL